MPLDHTNSTIEMHTAGEPFRIATSGFPRAPGARGVDRRAWLQANADHLRRALIFAVHAVAHRDVERRAGHGIADRAAEASAFEHDRLPTGGAET